MKLRNVAIACVVLVVAAEITLRLAWGLGTPILIRQDPACGYILSPNQHVHRFGVDVATNSYGMRSPEPAPEKSKDRVLFLGDSITYGSSQVDQSAIFTALIAKDLPIEVLNASAGAWAISNEFAYLQSRGTFGSDVIVLVLNTGDMPQPFSKLPDVGDSLPARRPYGAIDEVVERVVISRVLHSHHQDAGIDASHSDSAIVQQNLACLSHMKDFADSHRARLAVVYVPFRRDIASGATASVPSELKSWAGINQVPLLDLTPLISTHSLGSITLPDRTHFNAAGNQIIARGIEPWMRDRHLF